ncbi:ABC transporter ATP-binding protein [Shewanella sp. NIFS-20-20]|nr:ABC transporter ATP-binding protein [Shewanella sp. NIFS-20-20]MBV7316012.1 ABC transporter ATP-binding protein [Shewanella sp. NIFS-20-20]
MQQVGKQFGASQQRQTVLNHIDLVIEDGQSVALTGASGSGKSTLLSLIGLLDDISTGEYFLRDTQVNSLSRQQKSVIRNRHIGWIFQNFNLISSMSVIGNVIQPMRYHPDIDKKDYQARAMAMLDQVGMADKALSQPATLSGGEQQRVAIARALINRPSLILADEPTGNLDSENSQRVMDLLSSMSESGGTLILVTHDPLVAKICQRRLTILDGRIIDDVY